jgi:Ankyrin repeats (many copies)
MRLIHLAIAEARVDVLRLLIERGADLNIRNHDGRLPLHDFNPAAQASTPFETWAVTTSRFPVNPL